MYYNACFHSLTRWRPPYGRPTFQEGRRQELQVSFVSLVGGYEIRCTAMEMNYRDLFRTSCQQFIDIIYIKSEAWNSAPLG